MRWAGHVAQLEQKKLRAWEDIPEGYWILGTRKSRWRYIEADLRRLALEDMDDIRLI